MKTSGLDFQETRFAPIDQDHQEIGVELGRLLDAVNSNKPDETLRVMDALLDRCTVHFAREERLMEESRYPLAGRHKEAHDLFQADGRRAFVELKQRGITPGFRRWATGRLLEWFRFHVAANDVGLGLFLLAREAKRAPAVGQSAMVDGPPTVS